MTFDEIKEATLEELETRKAEIEALVSTPSEDVDFASINSELDALEERKSFLLVEKEKETRKADEEAILRGAGTPVTNIIPKENNKMDVTEIRSSVKYMDAFAEAMKTGDYSECRSLLSLNAPEDGSVAVPTIVEDKIRTAWEESELFSRISKSDVKGNLSIGFEISGSDAVIHEEGKEAPDEETLTLGVVTIVPKFIKKWITVSDEVMALRGEAFLHGVKNFSDQRIGRIRANEKRVGGVLIRRGGVPFQHRAEMAEQLNAGNKLNTERERVSVKLLDLCDRVAAAQMSEVGVALHLENILGVKHILIHTHESHLAHHVFHGVKLQNVAT